MDLKELLKPRKLPVVLTAIVALLIVFWFLISGCTQVAVLCPSGTVNIISTLSALSEGVSLQGNTVLAP